MNVIKEINKLHRQAWRQLEDSTGPLEKAASLAKSAYEKGENSPLFINNYAAVLLDLHRNNEALALLKSGEPVFSEYCLNHAIAIAKAAYDLELIRHWNQAATQQPKQEGAIVAYMDWQGL